MRCALRKPRRASSAVRRGAFACPARHSAGIAARAECATGARYHQTADIFVAERKLRNQIAQLLRQVGRERIQPLRPVERYRHDAVLAFHDQRLVLHEIYLLVRAARMRFAPLSGRASRV